MTRNRFPRLELGMGPRPVKPDSATTSPANDDEAFFGSISMGTIDPDRPGRSDPAVIIALAIRCGLMGQVTRTGIAQSLRGNLRELALAGDPAAQMVLDWLDAQMLRDLEDIPPDGAA